MSDKSSGAPATSGERVHTIENYYDGPREGIADFQRKPHPYKCQFGEANDDWTDLFWLMEIDQGLFELAKPRWAIFVQWRTEFDLGNVSLESHPALPADRTRYEELRTIGNRLQLQLERSATWRGHFVRRVGVNDTFVRWEKP